MSLPINSLYSLTWGDYGTSLVSAVQLLRCHGDLVDCTLAAGGRSFQAHKIVLCAASPYLLDLLKNAPCKHPIVMLTGVSANDLEALLEFVYRGEVSVDHSQLPSLLQAAHTLNIQGLAPQTVTQKDDHTTYTTSIQLQPIVQHQPQQHHHRTVIDMDDSVCNEEFIATIQPQQQIQQVQQVQEVVTEIMPDQLTEEMTKDMINQFLPQRKRKPRAKKPTTVIPHKIQRTGLIPTNMNNVSNTPTTSLNHIQTIQSSPIQMNTSVVTMEPETETESAPEVEMKPIITTATLTPITTTTTMPSVKIKQEKQTTSSGNNNAATSSGSLPTNADGSVVVVSGPSGSSPEKPKSKRSKEPKTKSQSEQPATCPICSAVIRQSRNLRRHLELRHFKKPTIKKEKKVAGIDNIKVEPGTTASGSSSNNNNSVTVTVASPGHGQSQQQQQQQQQPQQITQAQLEQIQASGGQQIVTQHENADGTTSLSIAHVQTLQGHQLQLGNLNQTTIIREEPMETAELITTHEPTMRPTTELFRVGSTVYTIEERRPE